jgi:hypothetical protein
MMVGSVTRKYMTETGAPSATLPKGPFDRMDQQFGILLNWRFQCTRLALSLNHDSNNEPTKEYQLLVQKLFCPLFIGGHS